VLLLDKPIGVGSNEALQIVKRMFDARKAGHTGSLDRLASGLLPLCFGEATKMSGFLLNADKRYLATFKLGIVTNTGDAEGEILEDNIVEDYPDQRVAEVLSQFRGEISQIPPMHSAIKHQGQRLYKLAHKGLTVEREPRTVTIHQLELTKREPAELHVDIRCSKGTYIRTLAEDVGII
jgi:tRNA pseudouridine55 synthase